MLTKLTGLSEKESEKFAFAIQVDDVNHIRRLHLGPNRLLCRRCVTEQVLRCLDSNILEWISILAAIIHVIEGLSKPAILNITWARSL